MERGGNRVKSDSQLIRMKFINQHLSGKSGRILFTEISSLLQRHSRRVRDYRHP